VRRIFWLAALGSIAAITLVIVRGTSFIPARLWLGPCLYDWSSAVSYHPRQSPLGSVRFRSGPLKGELCYGRPAARGRAIYGSLVPWHQLWRLGANEPTRLYLDHASSVAGLDLPAGRYSLYVQPDSTTWTLYVTRSVLHWGNDISQAVRSREVGNASLPVSSLSTPVDLFTTSTTARGDTVFLSFDWATTRFSVPVVPRP
jgi:hypothetical protein